MNAQPEPTPTPPDPVASHYDRWPFPGTEHRGREGMILTRLLGAWLADVPHPRVLDLGCGTGETLTALARRFPGASFLGGDVSSTALARARESVRDLGLENVAVRRLDITEPGASHETFDVTLAFGVLHHTPDPAAAFANLVEWTKPGGHLVLWLYGRHGRYAHRRTQELVRLLSGSDPERIPSVARALLRSAGAGHLLGTGFYTPLGDGGDGLEWLLEYPSWAADQLFPAVEHVTTLPEILDLFESNGVFLTNWLGVPTDPEQVMGDPTLLECFARLEARERLEAIDLLLRPPYYFVAGRRRDDADDAQEAS